jgi:hypothetical protein
LAKNAQKMWQNQAESVSLSMLKASPIDQNSEFGYKFPSF